MKICCKNCSNYLQTLIIHFLLFTNYLLVLCKRTNSMNVSGALNFSGLWETGVNFSCTPFYSNNSSCQMNLWGTHHRSNTNRNFSQFSSFVFLFKRPQRSHCIDPITFLCWQSYSATSKCVIFKHSKTVFIIVALRSTSLLEMD